MLPPSRSLAVALLVASMLALGLSQATPMQKASPFWLDDATLEASRRNRIVLENMLDRSAGGTVRLPAGVIHVDRAVMLKPEHSGVTLQGEGPSTVLQNSHEIATSWTNPSLVALGTGLGYADELDGQPEGARVTLANAEVRQHYEPGTLVYAFVWDGYLKEHVGQLATRRRVVRRIGLRDLELDGPVDPRCDQLKWLDGSPIRGPSEGDRTVTLEDPADVDEFTVGQSVLVTDGPVFANEARGEFRTIASIERQPPRVQLDQPLRCSYAADAALVRPKLVKDVTLRDFTIGAPKLPQALGACFKFCTGWRIQNVVCRSFLCVGGSSRLQFSNCDTAEQLELNTCHDVQIFNSRLRGFYLEEGCHDVGATDCRIGPARLNGVCAIVNCERLRITRLHISESTEMPISIAGRECVVESVVTEKTKDPANSSYIQGDGTTTKGLTSDINVIFRAGLRQVVDDVQAPSVMLGDATDDSPTGGTARNIRTPKLSVKSKAWTVEPNVDGPAKPR